MAGLITKQSPFKEGEIYLRWEQSRIDNNKNVISVTTGSTGSGKSMLDLRRAELTHLKRFNEEFPVEKNVCFSIIELMKRVSSGDLRKGEVLVLEEAGFNAGSQDWQNKTTKMFNYLLQTFRSMNICLYMNLPVLSMLAKQARQLIHIHFETCGIDFENNLCKVKPLVHQLNQHSGKSYWKYLRVKYNHKVQTVQRMSFGLASKNMRDKYEAKKAKFLSDMTSEFVNELMKKEMDKLQKLEREDLKEHLRETLEDCNEGLSAQEQAEKRKKHISVIYRRFETLKKKGYSINLKEKSQNRNEKQSQKQHK